MGANPRDTLIEQPVSRFFEGSTWDERINSCEATFDSIIDRVYSPPHYLRHVELPLTHSSENLHQNSAAEQLGLEER
jgi:hypothetical protein